MLPPLSVSVSGCSFHFQACCRVTFIKGRLLLPCDDDADQCGPSSFPLSAPTPALCPFFFPPNCFPLLSTPTRPYRLAFHSTFESVATYQMLLDRFCSHDQTIHLSRVAVTKLCMCCLICFHTTHVSYICPRQYHARSSLSKVLSCLDV